MPVATSPSAMPLTSRGCNLQNSAIWSKVNDVFSTSHTAVAFGINGASLILDCSLPWFGRAAPVSARRRRSLEELNSRGSRLYRRRGAELQSAERNCPKLPASERRRSAERTAGRNAFPLRRIEEQAATREA